MKTQLVLAFAIVGVAGAHAQILFTGPNITESFDTLSNSGTSNPWSDNSTILGWYATKVVNPPITVYRADNGTSNAGALYSFGTTGTSERALGSISSGTPGAISYGARIANNSSGTVQAFTLQYNGEQWRDGGAAVPNAQKLTFEYSLDATSLTTGTWNVVTNLNFTSPVFTNTGTGAIVDGNTTGRVAINTGALSTTLVSNWNVGTDIWIRWTDINDTGNDHGLGIDDIVFSATPVPEPATMVALVMGVGALVARRKRS
ncbi:MAG: PEP-CTERM sorting domain-containing protein [Chthonomonadaceae bacterium]|nr:PEP-CTERM sorting domain-containing protein [Chthonomonadaceae bacterium]